MKPVAILIHSGASHDSKLFDEILKNLQKRRIMRKKDIIIFDKGNYIYKNYQNGIIKYKIVHFIFPKDNFNKTKLDERLSYPSCVFNKINKINIEKKIIQSFKIRII